MDQKGSFFGEMSLQILQQSSSGIVYFRVFCLYNTGVFTHFPDFFAKGGRNVLAGYKLLESVGRNSEKNVEIEMSIQFIFPYFP